MKISELWNQVSIPRRGLVVFLPPNPGPWSLRRRHFRPFRGLFVPQTALFAPWEPFPSIPVSPEKTGDARFFRPFSASRPPFRAFEPQHLGEGRLFPPSIAETCLTPLHARFSASDACFHYREV